MTVQDMKTRVRSKAKPARLEARLSPDVKDRVQLAADLQGRTVSDFVVATLQQAADDAIREHFVITLSARDSRLFAEALLNPRQPTAQQRADVAMYLEDTVSLD